MLLFLEEAKKNPIQRRRREKLPLDAAPTCEDGTLSKGEQLVAVEMDVTRTKIAEPVADVLSAAEAVNVTQGALIQNQDHQETRSHYKLHTETGSRELGLLVFSDPEPRPAKCVKISEEEPVVIPSLRSVPERLTIYSQLQ